jgi:hypothetical protein
MKHLMIFAVGILLTFPVVGRADTAAPATLNFPRPDRAEVIATFSPMVTDGPKVELDAEHALQLATLVRAQTWYGPAGSCDKIQYILRFYANNKLIAADGICFHCGCFAPLDADSHPGDSLSFDLQSAYAKALETYLANFFRDTK